MDRRIFLLSGFALAGCGGASEGQVVICDPRLAGPLGRALAGQAPAGPIILPRGSPQALLEPAEQQRSALVVTRYSLIANRLQRLGYVRLEHRWQTQIGGQTVQVAVTRGGGASQRRALRLARWLGSEDAAPLLNYDATAP